MSVIIRAAEDADLKLVVGCHLEAFPSFFLSLLGPKFLSCFYKSFVAYEDAELLVALEENHIIGFAAYATEPKIFFSKIKREKGIELFWYALPALFKNPVVVVKKLYRGIFYRGDQDSQIDDAALLSSIGVSPMASGKRIGSKLLAEVESRVVQSGKNKLYLTTDLNDNTATLNFYGKNGYSEHSKFRQSDDRYMLRLIKQLS